MNDDGVGIRVIRHGPLAELVLDRPEALNALSVRLAAELNAATDRLAADAEIRAVVLSSAVPRAFCVGADLKERRGFTEQDFLRHRAGSRAAFHGVLSLPMPTVAAVQGYALGGGFELVLGCDLVVADRTAVFGLPEVTVGLVPGGGGTQLLPRRIGPGPAADLILTGRHVTAEEAVHLGVVNHLCDAGTARETALELAGRIAANAPVAVREARRAMRDGQAIPLAAALEIEDAAWHTAVRSADRREGIAAFTERRPPRWSGR